MDALVKLVHGRNTMALPKQWFLSVLVFFAMAMVLKDFSPKFGFLQIPRFGDNFRNQSLPVVKQYAPPTDAKIRGKDGYDGQFYAQIATDPLLLDPKLGAACDHLPYRAKRIGLPWLAYLLGLGNEWWVLQIYSVLNVGFWLWLAWMLAKHFGATTFESQLLLIGILWNAGVLTSISRALTDLPALAFSIAAVIAMLDSRRAQETKLTHGQMTQLWYARWMWMFSGLTKETSLLSLGSTWRSTPRPWQINLIVTFLVAVGPIAFWMFYVRYRVGSDEIGMQNFTWPFFGFFDKIQWEWSEAVSKFPRIPLLEILATLSIAVQVIWMLKEPRSNSAWWGFGIGHCFLAIMIASPVWASQTAYARCLLPLAVSFNIILSQSTMNSRRRLAWWWAGNIGFMDRAAIGLLVLGLIHLWKTSRTTDVHSQSQARASG